MNKSERDATIVRLYPIVRTIARTVASRVPCADLDELIGEGGLGLIRAVDSYDSRRGSISLERYVRRQVLHAMLNALRRADRVSEGSRRVLRMADRDRFATALQRGGLPSMVEMERRHPKLRFARVASYQQVPLSFDQDRSLESRLALNWELDPAHVYNAFESRATLYEAIAKLPPRHRQIVSLYYFAGYRLQAVARELSVTKQRIAQLRDAALERVREDLVSA
jgi:RNA polymerase sigma factor for flagellar operon FliA